MRQARLRAITCDRPQTQPVWHWQRHLLGAPCIGYQCFLTSDLQVMEMIGPKCIRCSQSGTGRGICWVRPTHPQSFKTLKPSHMGALIILATLQCLHAPCEGLLSSGQQHTSKLAGSQTLQQAWAHLWQLQFRTNSAAGQLLQG